MSAPLGFQKATSPSELGLFSLLSAAGRLARKRKEKACTENRLCFGTLSAGLVAPVYQLGPAWLKDRNEHICVIAMKSAGKRRAGAAGSPGLRRCGNCLFGRSEGTAGITWIKSPAGF